MEPSDIENLFRWVSTEHGAVAGVFFLTTCIFAGMWWLERKDKLVERADKKESWKAYNGLLERVITVLLENVRLLEMVKYIVERNANDVHK